MEEALAETRRVERDEAVKQKKVKRARFLPKSSPCACQAAPRSPHPLILASGKHFARVSCLYFLSDFLGPWLKREETWRSISKSEKHR